MPAGIRHLIAVRLTGLPGPTRSSAVFGSNSHSTRSAWYSRMRSTRSPTSHTYCGGLRAWWESNCLAFAQRRVSAVPYSVNDTLLVVADCEPCLLALLLRMRKTTPIYIIQGSRGASLGGDRATVTPTTHSTPAQSRIRQRGNADGRHAAN